MGTIVYIRGCHSNKIKTSQSARMYKLNIGTIIAKRSKNKGWMRNQPLEKTSWVIVGKHSNQLVATTIPRCPLMVTSEDLEDCWSLRKLMKIIITQTILVDHIGIKLYLWIQTINWKIRIYPGIVFQDHLFIASFPIEIRLCLWPATAFLPSKLLCDVLWLLHLSLVR